MSINTSRETAPCCEIIGLDVRQREQIRSLAVLIKPAHTSRGFNDSGGRLCSPMGVTIQFPEILNCSVSRESYNSLISWWSVEKIPRKQEERVHLKKSVQGVAPSSGPLVALFSIFWRCFVD
jgi:hypothetical protein